MHSIGSSSPPSSPLSSVASRSPTPPADYPSPSSSNVSDTGLPAPALDLPGRPPARDGPPPAKKQRIMKPKELKTEYLDLCALNDCSDEAEHKAQDRKLKRLMEALRSKRKIVVIAGAGISVSAGSMFLFSFWRPILLKPRSTRFSLSKWAFQHIAQSTQVKSVWKAPL